MKKLLGLFILAMSSLQASDGSDQQTWLAKIMGVIGKSSFMHVYSTKIQVKIDKATTHSLLNFGDEPASQKYQDLGREAQFAVGIPEHRHVPIKKINPESPMASLVGAVAESDAIYVNEEKMDKVLYGSVRSTFFHEAVHVKYHDKAMDQAIESFGLLSATVGTYAVLKLLNIASWNKNISLIVGFALVSYTGNKYHHFMERRADIEGHHATQCSCCVREHAQRRKQLFEVECCALKDNGYLWSADLERIAQNLGDKKCLNHAN